MGPDARSERFQNSYYKYVQQITGKLVLLSGRRISTEKWKLKNKIFSDAALTCKELVNYRSHP